MNSPLAWAGARTAGHNGSSLLSRARTLLYCQLELCSGGVSGAEQDAIR
jgi:hypothetical protein